MIAAIFVIIIALVFEFINGFHDTANSIATSVSTKILTLKQAVIFAAIFELIGALVGVSVATTIGKGLVDTNYVNLCTIFSALASAIAWNLLTWWLGLPSSSSHALIGGLCGATLSSAAGKWSVIKWSVVNPETGHLEGIWHKVIVPMIASPMCGFFVGFLFMSLLIILLCRLVPRIISMVFGKLQLLSAFCVAFSHGTNDAQKTMGVIALVLFTATNSNAFNDLPSWLQFLKTPKFEVALWVKVVCAIVLSAGTASGGWRIIKTMGHKVVRMLPIHGFAAQTTAAGIIMTASHWGIPLSTTHVISTSIMGVGATKRMSAVKWGIVGKIVWAWVLTIPITAFAGYWINSIIKHFL